MNVITEIIKSIFSGEQEVQKPYPDHRVWRETKREFLRTEKRDNNGQNEYVDVYSIQETDMLTGKSRDRLIYKITK